jgi:hypothetical protein
MILFMGRLLTPAVSLSFKQRRDLAAVRLAVRLPVILLIHVSSRVNNSMSFLGIHKPLGVVGLSGFFHAHAKWTGVDLITYGSSPTPVYIGSID